MSWHKWRWWFDAAAHDPLLDTLASSLLVWVAGASDGSGGHWSIDDDIVERLARRYAVEPTTVRGGFAMLERRGYITLRGDCEARGLQLGRVLFHLHASSGSASAAE